MEFCKKCGGVVVPKKEGKKVVFHCRTCGAKSNTGSESKLKEKVEKKEKVILMADKKEELPVTKVICGKCGNEDAFWWMQQTRAIDEPPTRFFRCTKCSHSWREYS
ncbi:MAG: transcription factor S [Candidatus Aenigmatarchaeota archaeon]